MAPKRRLGVDPANIIEGDARAKRRKEADVSAPPESSSPAPDAEPANEQHGQIASTGLDPAQIRDYGLQMWNAIKAARGKEDQDLSFDFMRLPSKRQYADYYIIIKHPICLEDIKANLDGSQYPTLESVKQDLDLCFKNARKYNMKESGIYKAAKILQKVAASEYAKLTGSEEDEVDVVGDDGSGDEGDKRKKKQSLSRVLKNKLNKLCEKSDESGRLLSTPFMDPPDRKMYADYYKIIKKVMCFDMIFKRLKRKEYQDIISFSSDVELIFSNAMEYNADHSVIWEDAQTLRDHFRKLMATLPPEYTQSSAGKIKLKLPGSAPKQDQLTIPEGLAASSSLTLKLPPTTARQTAQPLTTSSAIHEQRATYTPAVQPPEPTASPAPAGRPLLTAQASVPAATSAGSRGVFPAKTAAPASNVPAPSQIQTAAKQSTPQPQSYTPSPAPPEVPMKHPIQSLLLQTTPYGRTFYLDREEGVRLWSVRLGMSEKGIRVTEIHFVDEDDGSEDENEEEEESEDDGSASNKGNRRGAAKPKATKGAEGQKEKGTSGRKGETPEANVKLNGSVLRPTPHLQLANPSDSKPSKQWQSELSTGSSTLEVRAGDTGEIWKVYLDKQAG